jgi:hypothetical protein
MEARRSGSDYQTRTRVELIDPDKGRFTDEQASANQVMAKWGEPSVKSILDALEMQAEAA